LNGSFVASSRSSSISRQARLWLRNAVASS
jgi:hypothetical protein